MENEIKAAQIATETGTRRATEQAAFAQHAHLVDLAASIAMQAFAGKLDRSGYPKVLHSLRVGAAGKTWQTMVVGFLHDVLEDTDTSPSMLRANFDVDIMRALYSVTRVPGETYRAFINRSNANDIGREVKKTDLKDNLARLYQLPLAEAESLRRAYRNALATLGEM